MIHPQINQAQPSRRNHIALLTLERVRQAMDTAFKKASKGQVLSNMLGNNTGLVMPDGSVPSALASSASAREYTGSPPNQFASKKKRASNRKTTKAQRIARRQNRT